MKVALLFRRKNFQFFSIERVFSQVISAFSTDIDWSRIEMPAYGISTRNAWASIKLRLRIKFDIFHVTGDNHYLVLFLPGKRSVLTIHDCVFLQQRGIKGWILKKILLDWPVRRAALVSTISQKTKDEVVMYSGCSEQKVRVIANPVNQYVYFADREFHSEVPEILFIGSTPNKNFERTIKSLSGINCRLNLIGNYSSEQMELLKEYKINYSVKSNISDIELAEEYVNNDIILFPSLYEGFGLPVIEGFKAGRVVITSNLLPMKEVAEGAAVLVDPFDEKSIRSAVNKVKNEDDYRKQLIGRGFEVVKKYNPDDIAQQYIKMYKEIYHNICAE
ncbi:glycosyltransferase family 4 protein [Flavihumibacter profundi]|uniref:glycosyltransferase family 4 protein n=1 Tax=Flavihumibacter profundi TaxID=2716883 RepID=UPI001CC52CD6|nr:glycosyltransferase family 1 protein [Flavihumibacter profundi]MBZ5858005.1 glycosyltransferase family 4 protein [Flavihumibacter profundi]